MNDAFESSGSRGNKGNLTSLFTHTHTLNRVTVCPLTSLWVYTSTPNIVLWLWGGTVNHDVFRGSSGGWAEKCVCVWGEREGGVRDASHNLNQPFDADWPWHQQCGLSQPSSTSEEHSKNTHTHTHTHTHIQTHTRTHLTVRPFSPCHSLFSSHCLFFVAYCAHSRGNGTSTGKKEDEEEAVKRVEYRIEGVGFCERRPFHALPAEPIEAQRSC